MAYLVKMICFAILISLANGDCCFADSQCQIPGADCHCSRSTPCGNYNYGVCQCIVN